MSPQRKIYLIRYLPWLILFLSVSLAPATVLADYIRIKGTVVNVRQGPGTSHPVLFQAEQGEEFDLVSTEGLWCLIKIQADQEAWVFRKLVDVVDGNRPGTTTSEQDAEETGSPPKGLSKVAKLLFFLLAFVFAVVFFLKRRKILNFTGKKLREISGYKREQAFRYDNRKPSDDSWEL